MKKTVFSRIFALVLPVFLAGAATAQEEVELASTSKLTGIELPAGTLRLGDKSVPADVTRALTALIQASGPQVKRGRIEVLTWTGNGFNKSRGSDLMAEVGGVLRGSGWTYETSEQPDQGFSLVSATNTVPAPRAVIGFWAPTDEALVLAWTEMLAATPQAVESNPPHASNTPVAPAKSTSPEQKAHNASASSSYKGNGAVPAELIGSWRWTTISGSNYVDRTTGQITDNAGGMSAGFTFEKDGHYKFNFYVRQRTYGLVTEAFTTHEGTVTFEAGKFTLHPTKGHYRGSIAGKPLDRPMSQDEMKKNNVYFWKWATKDGKRQLMVGPSEDSMSHFKPAD